jgi:D-serine deaminase-like pyridoxal phosphate-dependent protein
VREINVYRAGDPVNAGDKALTRDTPAQRGRVNRYGIYCDILDLSCMYKSYKCI